MKSRYDIIQAQTGPFSGFWYVTVKVDHQTMLLHNGDLHFRPGAIKGFDSRNEAVVALDHYKASLLPDTSRPGRPVPASFEFGQSPAIRFIGYVGNDHIVADFTNWQEFNSSLLETDIEVEVDDVPVVVVHDGSIFIRSKPPLTVREKDLIDSLVKSGKHSIEVRYRE